MFNIIKARRGKKIVLVGNVTEECGFEIYEVEPEVLEKALDIKRRYGDTFAVEYIRSHGKYIEKIDACAFFEGA